MKFGARVGHVSANTGRSASRVTVRGFTDGSRLDYRCTDGPTPGEKDGERRPLRRWSRREKEHRAGGARTGESAVAGDEAKVRFCLRQRGSRVCVCVLWLSISVVVCLFVCVTAHSLSSLAQDNRNRKSRVSGASGSFLCGAFKSIRRQ